MELILRAHHIFCIQGFRGKGYNEEFVSNMTNIVRHLNKEDNIMIKVVNTPDYICLSCPNNIGQDEMIKFEVNNTYDNKGFCENERYIKNLDNQVLETLSIDEGSIYSYDDLLLKIKQYLTEEKFENICGNCKWYSLGYCREGLIYNS